MQFYCHKYALLTYILQPFEIRNLIPLACKTLWVTLKMYHKKGNTMKEKERKKKKNSCLRQGSEVNKQQSNRYILRR